MSVSENVVTYEEQILDENLPELDHHRRLGRDRRRVRLRDEELRRRRDDRGVPRPDGADRGRRRVQGAAQALQEARREGAALAPRSTSVEDTGERGQGDRQPGRRRRQRRCSRPTRCSPAFGFAPRVEGYGLDSAGVELTDRGAIAVDGRGRTNVDGVYAIGDVTGQDDARPRGRGDGHRRRRDDRRRGDHGDRLRHDPAGDVLPAADRLVRLLRGSRPRRRGTTSRRRRSRSRPTARPRASATPSAS